MSGKFIAFVLPLGFDTLAIAVALGFGGLRPLRPALLFALFEMAMPLVGIFLGRIVSQRFELAATLIGGAILIAVGVHAFREAAEEGREAAQLSFDTMRAAALAGIAISTDELAAGFPMGASGLPVAPLIAALGIQAFVVTIVGIWFGRRAGAMLGRKAVRVSGTIAGLAFAGVGLWLIVESFVPHKG